jgi:hypothetical protein
MDFKDTIEVIEDYAKSYIHYILGFFGDLGDDAADIARGARAAPELTLNDGSLLIFGLFNALIGSALQGLFMEKLKFSDINFPQAVIVEVCYWLFLAILLHIALNVFHRTSHFSSALTAILRVVPVAFVIGAYGAFVAYFITLAAAPGVFAPWVAALAFASVEVVLLGFFLSRAIAWIKGPSLRRKVFACVSVIGLVAAIQFLVLTVTFPDVRT